MLVMVSSCYFFVPVAVVSAAVVPAAVVPASSAVVPAPSSVPAAAVVPAPSSVPATAVVTVREDVRMGQLAAYVVVRRRVHVNMVGEMPRLDLFTAAASAGSHLVCRTSVYCGRCIILSVDCSNSF